eukprot:1993549-Pyramimonas_sp.AAC.1
MLRPSLITRWMRPANCVGSSRLKPEVSNAITASLSSATMSYNSEGGALAGWNEEHEARCHRA